jgi:hypothetical protein
MPAPSTGRELHIDTPLSNLVVGRRPEGFIADRLLPVVPVTKQSDLYYKFAHLEWFRNEAGLTLRAPGTEAKKVSMTVSSDSYFAPNYALGAEWPVEDEVNADQVLQWARSNAEYLADRLLMDYEVRLANLAVSSSNVATIFLASSGWNSPGRTAFTDLITWRDAFKDLTGLMPNTLIIPRKVMSKLKINDQFRDILFGDRGGVVSAQQIGNLLDISNVLEPQTQVNTAVEADPQGGTLADVWDGNGNIWMARINTMQGMFTDTWMQAFRWTNPLFGTPMAVQRYPFDAKKKIFGIEVSYYQDEKVVSNDLAIRVSSLTAT